MSKGSALLLTILIIGLISIISLGISRISIAEIKMASSASDSTAAYFAAEAGLEEGLARWRWNRNVEVPSGATETSTDVWRCDLSTNNCSKVNATTLPSNPNNKYYDLKIWYKAGSVGNFANLNDSNNPVLDKNQVWEFDVEGLNSIRIKYKILNDYTLNPFPPNNIDHGVEISQSKVDNTWSTDFKDQSNDTDASDSDGLQITIGANTKLIRIKPWDCRIRFAISPDPAGVNIDSGTTYIESTGIYKNTKRKLVAKIDRKSGTILGVYDFVIYAGSELKN